MNSNILQMLIFECTNTVTMASSVKGFDKLIKRLDAASKNFQQEVKEILEQNTALLERAAIRDAPKGDTGILTQGGKVPYDSISEKRRGQLIPIDMAITYDMINDGFTGRVMVDKSAGDVAIYTEAGTGQSARTYLATVPADFREYVRRFYVNGKGTILAQPYLLPNFFKYELIVIKELKQALKDIKI